ncbi:MAG: hypothetical protein Q9220_006925 [cf. Caloplaca sp. 1 TL-2023]
MLGQGPDDIAQSDNSEDIPSAQGTRAEANDHFPGQGLAAPQLTPFPDLTGLRPREKNTGSRSKRITSSVQRTDLQSVAAALDASPASVLQAVWAIILSTYCGAHENIIFATAILPLPNHGLKSGIDDDDGVSLNRLCLDISGDWLSTTGGDLIKRTVASQTVSLPFRKNLINEDKKPQLWGCNGTLLVEQICYQPDEKSNIPIFSDKNFAFNLLVSCLTSGSLELEAVYSGSVLADSGALVVLNQFSDILAAVLQRPAQSIKASLAVVRTSLQSSSNLEPQQPAREGIATQYLHSQFEHFARDSPWRVALEFRLDLRHESEASDSNTIWTYGELNARANAFAQFLIHRFGLLSDEIVPICMDRCPELYVAILGILKSGGAWCPVDSSFPPRRRHDLIARAGAKMIVVANDRITHEAESVPQGVEIINIMNMESLPNAKSTLSDVEIGDLAYLIWTSGTTGNPKGVPVQHGAAVASMGALQKCIPVDISGEPVRCLQFSHFTFDVFVQDLFYTWGKGGTVISSSREIMLGSFAELANQTKASHAHLTPAFAASVPRRQCHTLRVVTMIGEKLPQAVADDWSQDMQVFNTYGPAEAAVVSTFRQFGDLGDQCLSDNIGFPLPSVSTFVLRDGIPVLKHAVGELALGGPQVSKGYWKDPEKTADRFIWNEYASRYLYMTGDMVRQIADGSLQFIGRQDDLIKIQGIRVELSEISFNMRLCHPLVEQIDTQYLSREDRPSKIIVAFLAAPQLDNENAKSSWLVPIDKATDLVRSAMIMARDTLPDYMIPRAILVINHIPRTSSAKTDRITLQNIYSSSNIVAWERIPLSSSSSQRNGSTIWDHTESKVIATIAELAGTSCNSMSRFSDLRSVGVDSITATRLAPSLNAAGISVSIANILQCQKLDDLLRAACRPSPVPMSKSYDVESFHRAWYDDVKKSIKIDDFLVVPALPFQKSLLSESMQNPDAYWGNTFLAIDSLTSLTRLREAWKQVVRGTDSLRTGFLPAALMFEDGRSSSSLASDMVQLIYGESTLPWYHVNVTDGNFKDTVAQKARQIAAEHQKAHFRNPPIAVTIIEHSNERTMMISIHHSIRDEASLDFILEDVQRSYHDGEKALIQRHQLHEALPMMLPTKDQIKSDEAYWSKTLKDFATADAVEVFPDMRGKNKRRNDTAEEFVSHLHTLTISYKDMQDAALSLGGTSVASIMQVAWGCLLLMYLEIDAVVFAETVSNRIDDPALANVVGPLTSVLPVPFRALGSVREVLTTQAQAQRERRVHKFINGSAVRKLLGRADQQSVYPALFNFMPASSSDDHEDAHTSLWAKTADLVSLTVEHPLALNVLQTAGNTVQLELVGSQNVISADHLAVLACQVETFVVAMLQMPDQPIMQLPRYFPKSLISMTAVSFSEEVKSARKLEPTFWVDQYAASHPHWPAVEVFDSISTHESPHRKWNFGELRSAYRKVASFLNHAGYCQQMIAVCLDRRLEAYAIILGILASGNIYLPIDEELPEERKSFLLSDSHAIMLFTTSSLASMFANIEIMCRIISVDANSYPGLMADSNSNGVKKHSKPGDNAYLLYTSGSTGVPKGVLVGRGNLCSFVEGLSEYIISLVPGARDFPGKGKYLGLASRAFDVHIAEMFLAWRQGLAAVTAPRALLLDNLELALQTLKITHASFVPSLIDQAGLNPAHLPDLRYLGVGGEKMSNDAAETWASNKNTALINAYGPTEMSIGCTAAEVIPDSNLKDIGRPYGNSVAHVLVPGSDQHTLRGVAGELCFTGDLVANGYYNRPDARGFVDDFHSERMYRTGDIVRMMADDSLQYLRREDDQTKVRGQRLELGEISEAIRSAPIASLGFRRVDVSTMIAKHPQLPRPQLVSFVATQRQQNDDPNSREIRRNSKDRAITDDMQRHCARTLPSYMVPDVILPLARLPIAPTSGKADLKRLKTLFADLALEDIVNQTRTDKSDRSWRELSSDEMTVKNVVLDTLANSEAQLSPDTNLLKLGLDSLTAINLSIRMQRLGYSCTVTGVLRNPTLEKLALLPRQGTKEVSPIDKNAQARSDIVKLQARFLETHSEGLGGLSMQAVKPCLPLQETLVAASIDNERNTLYVNHVRLELSRHVDLAKFHKAWISIVESHGILRTCFRSFENGFVQVVLKANETSLVSWEEVTTSSPMFDSINMQNHPAGSLMSDVGRTPPWKLTLFRATSNEQNSILLFQIHHALYDRESFTMILDDLDKRYHGFPVSNHTPVDSLIEYVLSQDQEASKDFWRHYLRQYKPVAIKPQNQTSDGNPDSHAPSNPNRLLTVPLASLEEYAASIGGTLTTTIQSVFGIILAQKLETQDIVFGAVLSGRTVPIEDAQSIVAPCLTTIPQRVNLSVGSPSLTDILQTAQEGFVESLEYQHTSLRHIHRWVEVDRPLFDCLVTCVRKQRQKPGPDPQLWTELEDSMVNDEQFALSVEFEADHESDQLRVQCSFTSVFGDAESAAAFLEGIDLLLGALVRQEHITLSDLGISSGNGVDRGSIPQIWDESEWTSTELKMKEIVAHMCHISAEDVSKSVSFFQVGIDSITAIQFARRLRESQIECSSADVMRHTCIGALAQYLQTQTIRTADASRTSEQSPKMNSELLPRIPLLDPDDTITNTYQCTPLQSSMLTQTLGSSGRLYANHHAIRLSVAVGLSRLQRTVQDLVPRTEVLRTSFHFSSRSNAWFATVHKLFSPKWTEQSFTGKVSEALGKISDNSVLDEEASFNEPPWKLILLKGTTETVLIMSMHHSLYDGVSIQLLFDDLARLYNKMDMPSRPPFSRAAQAITSSTPNDENFWLQKLEGFEGIDVSQPADNGAGQGVVEVEKMLSMSTDKMIHSCKILGVTLQTVALLAYAKSLACLFGRRDIVFGHVVGGRSLAVPDADEIIGPLFNTVPCRVSLDKTYRTNASMATEIQEFSGDSQVHQQASLSKIQQAWRKKVGDPDTQLLDALFVFQHNTKEGRLGQRLWTPVDTSRASASTEYSINLEFEQTQNTIIAKVVAREAFIDRERLLAWLTEFEHTFEEILAQPSRSVLAFPASLQGLPLKVAKGKSELPAAKMIEPGPDLDCIRSALSQVSSVPAHSITIDGSIFSLGLDSIAAIHVAAACRKQGHDVSVADVLQGRSLAGICRRLRAKSMQTSNTKSQLSKTLVSMESRARALELLSLNENDVEHVLPCLAGQVYHLAAWLKFDRRQYQGIFTYRTSKRINAGFLNIAWTQLRERHSVLRTVFVAVSPTEAIQVVLKPSALNETFQYTRIRDQNESIEYVESDRQAQRPSDLYTPPSALHLVRGLSGCHVHLKLHHVVYDAWTIRMIMSDLEHFYQTQQSNHQPRQGSHLASPPSFEAFVEHTVHFLDSEAEERYWRKSLVDCEQTHLPDHALLKSSERTSSSTRPVSVWVPFRAAITDVRNIEARCQAFSTSVSTIILLSFARTLARHTSVIHPTFGLYQTGRSASFDNIEQLCAPCFNITPVCVQNALGTSPMESAQRLQTDLAERVPFEQSYLSDILKYAGHGDSKPLFNTYVNILPTELRPRLSEFPSDKGALENAESLFTDCPWPETDASITTVTPRTEAPWSVRKAPAKTTVDDLDTSYLAKHNLYLDVVRREEGDSIGFGISCDTALMNADDVETFGREIVEEFRKVLEMMQEERGSRSQGSVE